MAHSTGPDAPHCGPFDHVVFSGITRRGDMAVCICLEPGQHYGCRIGPPGQPAELSFSVDGTKVRADFDWHRIGDRDWASLSITHDGITVTVRVGRPETPDGMPLGRIEITDHDTRAFDLDPATILHDLPFD